jgi:hypothetical protein
VNIMTFGHSWMAIRGSIREFVGLFVNSWGYSWMAIRGDVFWGGKRAGTRPAPYERWAGTRPAPYGVGSVLNPQHFKTESL